MRRARAAGCERPRPPHMVGAAPVTEPLAGRPTVGQHGHTPAGGACHPRALRAGEVAVGGARGKARNDGIRGRAVFCRKAHLSDTVLNIYRHNSKAQRLHLLVGICCMLLKCCGNVTKFCGNKLIPVLDDILDAR